MQTRKGLLRTLGFMIAVSLLGGCSGYRGEPGATDSPDAYGLDATSAQVPGTLPADVISVRVAGDPDAYQFSVAVSSPDEGCEQYADWWEVLTDDGVLIYRRILTHSHVDEQPFTRSGGPVTVDADTRVLIRAHMNPGGYGGSAMRGTASDGFEAAEMDADFASGVEHEPPQPTDCAF